jgi:hypothetical protein
MGMPGMGGMGMPGMGGMGGMNGMGGQGSPMMMIQMIMQMMQMMMQMMQMMMGGGCSPMMGGMPGMGGMGMPGMGGMGMPGMCGMGMPGMGGMGMPGMGGALGNNLGNFLGMPGMDGMGGAGTVPTTPLPLGTQPPHGRAGIEAMFGPPGTNQVTTSMPAGPGGKMIKVTCHAKIADKLRAAFEEIKQRGLSDEIKSFDGCFNNRNKRGGSSKSIHAWGIGVDINAGQHPMGSNRQTQGQRQIAEIMAKHGFKQLPNDPMHFQFATGY